MNADEDGFQDKIRKLRAAQKKDDAASSENEKKGQIHCKAETDQNTAA